MPLARSPSPPSSPICSATSRSVYSTSVPDHIQNPADVRAWQKIRERFLAAPTESETVQDLVRNEIKSKKHVAAEGLLWLTR
jgi:hypothetical protein